MRDPDSIFVYFKCPDDNTTTAWQLDELASEKPYCPECDGDVFVLGWMEK